MALLQNKVCIVTGGCSGIGKAIAIKSAKEGATVVIWDVVGEDIASDVVKECKNYTNNVVYQQVDVADREKIKKSVEEVVSQFGRIDCLVNNAGITRDALLEKMEEQMWDDVIRINLKGVFNCTQLVLPTMIENKKGSIVNISSVVGLYGNVGQTNYAAAKAGVIGMSLTWAKEFARYGEIRVNVVCPGFIKTPMTEKVPQKIIDMMIQKTPLRRMGLPEEVANVVCFLCSDESSFVTGSVIEVTGGLVL